jgi:hypothetical protein
MKRVAETLGVARSNLAGRACGKVQPGSAGAMPWSHRGCWRLGGALQCQLCPIYTGVPDGSRIMDDNDALTERLARKNFKRDNPNRNWDLIASRRSE